MEINIALGSSQGFASLSSEARIESNTAKIERLKARKKAALAKVKAATTAAKPAFKALEKAKKAGRVPAAIKAAAKKAQDAIDAVQEKVDQADKRITYLTARNELHRSNLQKKLGKPTKVVKPAKKTKAAKEEPAAKKIRTGSRRPEKRIVSRPGSLVKRPSVEKEVVEKAPAKKTEPAAAPQPTAPQPTAHQFKRSHPQDVQFATPFLNPEAFSRAKKKLSRIAYLRALWKALNRGVFHNKLTRMPSIGLLRNMDAAKTKTYGMFYPGRHVINMSPRLFDGEEPILIAAMGHEMAHQYVWDMNPSQGMTHYMQEGGHGPEWKRAMTMIGLTPARFIAYDRTTFMDENTKAKHVEEQHKLLQTLKTIEDNNVAMNPKALRIGTPIAYVETLDANKRYKGIVVGMGTSFVWALAESRFSTTRNHVIKVPKRIIKVPTDVEAAALRQPVWQDYVQGAIDSVNQTKMAKQRLRESKRMEKGLRSGKFNTFDLHDHLKKWTGL